jgi:hypothetical protein
MLLLVSPSFMHVCAKTEVGVMKNKTMWSCSQFFNHFVATTRGRDGEEKALNLTSTVCGCGAGGCQ